MKAPFFVEILSRSKDVKFRYQQDNMPIRIGRAYDNDIILDDAHIAAHHAIIEQDGEENLTIQDLGSRNGIIIGGHRQTESRIDSTTVFQLGHTHLRIRSIDCNVEDEIPISNFHKWNGWPPALAGIVMITLVIGFITWAGDANKFEASSYLGGIAIALLCGVTWSCIWAFASRLFGGEQTRFGRHLFILGCGLTAIVLVDCTYEIIAYALSLEVITRYSSHVDIALVFIIIFFHLQQISPNNFRRLSIICIALSLLSSSTMLLYNYRTDKILADELTMRVRFPSSIRFSADKPISKLLDDAKLLKTKLDKENVVNDDDDSGDDEKAVD